MSNDKDQMGLKEEEEVEFSWKPHPHTNGGEALPAGPGLAFILSSR
jgi:hypothetical protein